MKLPKEILDAAKLTAKNAKKQLSTGIAIYKNTTGAFAYIVVNGHYCIRFKLFKDSKEKLKNVELFIPLEYCQIVLTAMTKMKADYCVLKDLHIHGTKDGQKFTIEIPETKIPQDFGTPFTIEEMLREPEAEQDPYVCVNGGYLAEVSKVLSDKAFSKDGSVRIKAVGYREKLFLRTNKIEHPLVKTVEAIITPMVSE